MALLLAGCASSAAPAALVSGPGVGAAAGPPVTAAARVRLPPAGRRLRLPARRRLPRPPPARPHRRPRPHRAARPRASTRLLRQRLPDPAGGGRLLAGAPPDAAGARARAAGAWTRAGPASTSWTPRPRPHGRPCSAIVGGWFDGCAPPRLPGRRAGQPRLLDAARRRRRAHPRPTTSRSPGCSWRRAHADGLADRAEERRRTGDRAPRLGFDFAVAEECQVYRRVRRLHRGLRAARDRDRVHRQPARRPYTRPPAPPARGRISVILRDRDVVPRGDPAYRYAHC